MSTSYGSHLDMLQCMTARYVPSPKLFGYSTNLCMRSSCISQKFLASPMASKRLDVRSRDGNILCSTSSSSPVETTEDNAEKLTYKDAGVDIDAGSELVRRIAKMAPGIGGFGGLFPLGMISINSLPLYF